ncbi:MAG: cyclic nucleotide-binding domain-containing protein [Elusimicrobia bacterium]|nr:cyclic nucleotide-binding domain-containing protein [Elusimicrobiota bacterium]
MTPEEIPAWEPFLKRIPLFAGLSGQDLARIAARLQTLSLPKNSLLFSQGDESDALYIVVSGQVRIINTAKGGETVAAILGRGEMLGEGGVLTGEPRTVTVRLATTCEFLKLPRKDFEEVLRENPAILLHLSRLVTKRLVETNRPQIKTASANQLMVLNAALSRQERLLLTVHLGLELMEQTRRRVLLVDMTPDAGSVARAVGLKPVLADEKAIREINLRDPGQIRTLAQQHPSGLEILSLPASTLGGRLYSGIYLFLNFLREVHDIVLVSLSGELGDVEKSILSEADHVLLSGAEASRPQFRQLEAELGSLVDPKRLQRLWLGETEHEDAAAALLGAAPVILPWPDSLTDEFERSGSPYKPMEAHPKTRLALERLARSLGGVKVGLALGTGAALGHSLIGILKVFKREGIPIDMIAGTSIGSLIGGFTALGMEPEEIQELAVKIDKGWVYENLFWDLTIPRSGIFAGQTLLRFIRSFFGSKEFHELELPYACVATDIETGEEVILRDGRVAESIRASCGLPLIFAPERIGGRYLVDGGLVNPVPTSVVSDMGADIVLAVNLTMPAADRPRQAPRGRPQGLLSTPVDLKHLKDLTMPEMLKAPNLMEVFFQMIYTMEYEVAQNRLALAHVVIHPDLKGFSWTEMHRARELIRAGERVAEQYVPQIKSLIPYFADYCKVPVRLSSPWTP